MTRNRQNVILSKAAYGLNDLATALALLPDDQHPQVHHYLNGALHALLIIAEEIRQEWDSANRQCGAIE
ncbi:MAG: hypothetical protein JSR91_00285 [Proteobacteria bacterium]|nr:hypothetical protein [Pseudomonadota bacterium]